MKNWTVIDLFSGAGGMSYGFHAHPSFQIVAAVDKQMGKPSSRPGSLQCNKSYEANIGLQPFDFDLLSTPPSDVRSAARKALGKSNPTVLISCAPCTGFSRTNSKNHVNDDPRNSLVYRSALYVEELKPEIFLMENARELIMGNFSHHYENLSARLDQLGYTVHGRVHKLNQFGLPQQRERALVIAVKSKYKLRTIEDLWEGLKIRLEATHVRRAISHLPALAAGESDSSDPFHVSPSFSKADSLERLKHIPQDGGSWLDLLKLPKSAKYLTPAMRRYVSEGDFGSHPDVYGRLWWDKPAVTIKRECSHTGNGRYAHPEQHRLCTVREMAILQGFPSDYQFASTGVSNMYRHIGDAVPPLISYQLANVCQWILSGKKPNREELVLPKTHLTAKDIQARQEKNCSKDAYSSELELATELMGMAHDA